MLLLKRFVVWLMEMLCQVPLAIVLLMLVSDPSTGDRSFDLRLLLFGVLLFMIGSGYVVSTAIVATFFRSRTPWLYPAVAALLFIVHEQFFLTGWELPTRAHLQIQASGAGVVFATTLVGGRYLRKSTSREPKTI